MFLYGVLYWVLLCYLIQEYIFYSTQSLSHNMLYMLYNIILLEPSTSFSVILWLVTITVTMLTDVTDVWQYDHDITLTLTLDPNKENKRKKEK